LRVYLYLANAYNLTKKDIDKAYSYTEQVIELAKTINDATQDNTLINNNFIAPALRIQVQLLAANSQDPQNAMKAFNKALEAYQLDKSEKSANFVLALSDRMHKADKVEDAIRGLETINQSKPSAGYYNTLGKWYNQIKNMPKAIENFKASYQMKKSAQVAYNLGILLNQAQQLDSALEYLAEAHLLNDEKISPEALKLFEHLIFFEKTKGLPQPEQEMVYNELLAAAKIRLGITLP